MFYVLALLMFIYIVFKSIFLLRLSPMLEAWDDLENVGQDTKQIWVVFPVNITLFWLYGIIMDYSTTDRSVYIIIGFLLSLGVYMLNKFYMSFEKQTDNVS